MQNDVLVFIRKFKNRNPAVIESLFTDDYCYYFALILQTAFARGSLQITSDCSHIVWKDTNGRQYDIKGINEEETRPLENRKELIPQFLHGGEL